MSRIHACLTSCLLVGGVLCVSAVPACAQSLENAGVVRVTDGAGLQPVPENGAISGGMANCPPGGQVIYTDAGYGAEYGGGGYRFSPPVKRPIYRSPVSYTKGFSDAWTGNTTGPRPLYRAPTVYMPTDTTQLGFYYQSVPYWQPKPGAIPPPPVPSQWHTTVGQLPTYGPHPAGIIYGTAPTAVPFSPTPPPWDAQGLPPSPSATSVQATNGVQSVQALERSEGNPLLLPIVE